MRVFITEYQEAGLEHNGAFIVDAGLTIDNRIGPNFGKPIGIRKWTLAAREHEVILAIEDCDVSLDGHASRVKRFIGNFAIDIQQIANSSMYVIVATPSQPEDDDVMGEPEIIGTPGRGFAA